jgi:hypothetical protein
MRYFGATNLHVKHFPNAPRGERPCDELLSIATGSPQFLARHAPTWRTQFSPRPSKPASARPQDLRVQRALGSPSFTCIQLNASGIFRTTFERSKQVPARLKNSAPKSSRRTLRIFVADSLPCSLSAVACPLAITTFSRSSLLYIKCRTYRLEYEYDTLYDYARPTRGNRRIP